MPNHSDDSQHRNIAPLDAPATHGRSPNPSWLQWLTMKLIPRLTVTAVAVGLLSLVVWLAIRWQTEPTAPIVSGEAIQVSEQIRQPNPLFPEIATQLPVYSTSFKMDSAENMISLLQPLLPNGRAYFREGEFTFIQIINNEMSILVLADKELAAHHWMYFPNDIEKLSFNDVSPLPFAEASAHAIAFLEEHDLLPDQYQIEEDTSDFLLFSPSTMPAFLNSTAVYIFPKTAQGYSVEGIAMLAVFVAPTGQILMAIAALTDSIELHWVDIIPAETVYQQYKQGDLTPIKTHTPQIHTSDDPWTNAPRFFPTLTNHQLGDILELEGDIAVAEALDGGADLVEFTAANGTIYYLQGDLLQTIELNISRYGGLMANGRMQIQIVDTAVDGWHAQITQWQPGREIGYLSVVQERCLKGTLSRTVDGEFFTADEPRGENDELSSYRLLDLPDTLQHGRIVQVCTYQFTPTADVFAWSQIQYIDPFALTPTPQPPPPQPLSPDGFVLDSVALVYLPEQDLFSGGSAFAYPTWRMTGHMPAAPDNIIHLYFPASDQPE